ncbi:aldo/keto reductase, partial [bacterium]|nr:aldo/keto reductase [bacterium]
MPKTRLFGRTGWRVAEIGLGGWQFGGAITLDGKPEGWSGITDADAVAAIRRALDLGVNFFDTADMYGWGHSEDLLGATLQDAAAAVGGRDRLYLASKVGYWHDDQDRRTVNESVPYILRACEDSLRRLRTEHLDLYQCHVSETTRWPEFLDAFERLQRAGKIRAYGVSTLSVDLVRQFDEAGKLGAVQTSYNLLERDAERTILPYCRARGIALVVRGLLAMGKLSGKYTPDFRFAADDIRSRWVETEADRAAFAADLAVVEQLRGVAEKYGFTLPQLALKYMLSNVAVSVVIPGAR